MSKEIARKKFLFSTAIGTVMVDQKVIQDSDVEDMLEDLVISQARTLQLQNLGRQIDANANLPVGSIPTVFLDPNGQDDEEIL